MHEIQLRRMGGSVGTTFPKEMIEEMHLEPGDKLFLVKRNGEYVLTPYDPDFEETMEAFESVRREFRNAFRELAK
jgi:putative addiction module antidote